MAPDQPAGPAPRSPCVGLCEMAAGTGRCRGCLRTLDEIAGWSSLGPAGQRSLLGELARRRVAAREGR